MWVIYSIPVSEVSLTFLSTLQCTKTNLMVQTGRNTNWDFKAVKAFYCCSNTTLQASLFSIGQDHLLHNGTGETNSSLTEPSKSSCDLKAHLQQASSSVHFLMTRSAIALQPLEKHCFTSGVKQNFRILCAFQQALFGKKKSS